MKHRIVMTLGFTAASLALSLCGCSSGDPSQPSQANAAQSQPYNPGTGVSSSSFDRHPRFYTGPNGQPDPSPATQPASP